MRVANSSKRYRASWGPGPASGWYCTEKARSEDTASPSITPSFKLTWVTTAPGTESAATA